MEDWKSSLSEEELEMMEGLSASQILQLLHPKRSHRTGESLLVSLPISWQRGSKESSEKSSEKLPVSNWESTLVPENGMREISLVDEDE